MASYLPNESFISHLYLAEDMNLYIVITTPDQYIIYERDLDRAMKVIFDSGNVDTPDKN